MEDTGKMVDTGIMETSNGARTARAPVGYVDSVRAYTEGVRGFFAPGPAPEVEAGRERFGAGPGTVSVAELTRRAEVLAPLSAELTDAAAARLEAAEVDARLQAPVSLLAKALTDLEVSRALLRVVEEEAPGAAAPVATPRPRGAEAERGAEALRGAAVTRPAHLELTLQLLLEETPAGAQALERGVELPKTLPAARAALAGNAETTLLLIRDRAANAGWEALGGIAGMGLSELAQAASLAGRGVAELLGQGANLHRLVELVHSFLGEAIRSLQALLGPAVTQAVGGQVADWLKDAVTEKKFTRLVEKLYETEATGKALRALVKQSPADLEAFVAALQAVEALELAYRRQVELVGKLLKALKALRAPLSAALPQGALVFVAVYMLVGGYVVLAGGDYVDAEKLARIDRVPGVRKGIEMKLVQAP